SLKSFVHRKSWERIGIVQWTRGHYAAVRWVSCEASLVDLDLSRFPVTQRDTSELESFVAEDTSCGDSDRALTECW
ncbi:MAG: hypothetical protein KC931_27100, partial [Candidatus Omnitrophica bacterium]|nr:hypothetical protein [Candidatus Omnitrophota bacterium]